jgi:hypothetical protein
MPPLPKRGPQAKFNIIRNARANCKFWGNFYFPHPERNAATAASGTANPGCATHPKASDLAREKRVRDLSYNLRTARDQATAALDVVFATNVLISRRFVLAEKRPKIHYE